VVDKTLALYGELKTVQAPLVNFVIAVDLVTNFLEIALHLRAELPKITVNLPEVVYRMVLRLFQRLLS